MCEDASVDTCRHTWTGFPVELKHWSAFDAAHIVRLHLNEIFFDIYGTAYLWLQLGTKEIFMASYGSRHEFEICFPCARVDPR
jgi:hypothetical protein